MRRNDEFRSLVWKSFVLVHVHVLHIPLCTSQNGSGGKSCTECTGQSEGSSPGTGGGVCTDTKIILGLWGCAWSPRQGQCQVSTENLLWLKSNWGLVVPWIWWTSDLGNRIKTGHRNAFHVVMRSSHLQAPALGLLVLVGVDAQLGSSVSGIDRNWKLVAWLISFPHIWFQLSRNRAIISSTGKEARRKVQAKLKVSRL